MCGIFGIVTKEKRSFDYTTFCTLGIVNDTRGGDSCGYFIDDHYEYGAKGMDKLFQWFFQGNEFLEGLQESTIAFGHCRKASVGVINETTAQPVVITNKGKVEYVLMHNGTIHNYKELAEKYIPEIDITGMTDSQVMAHIFYNKGYAALSEYIGGAVFAIADYRNKNPKVLLFKGASKKYRVDKEETEERPLYYCLEDGKLIFSSISSCLIALKQPTWIVESNYLYEFTSYDLIPIKKISRDKVCQEDKYLYRDTFGLYKGYGNMIFDDFITLNHTNNTYYGKGKLLNGLIHLSPFGKMHSEAPKKADYRSIYFWNGIALKNAACYRFLSILKKETNLPNKEFNEKFNNLIRYLSIDGVYCINNCWFRATSPSKRILFTGTLEMLTSTNYMDFVSGHLNLTRYGRETRESFNILNNARLDLNFKEIKKECESMMK